MRRSSTHLIFNKQITFSLLLIGISILLRFHQLNTIPAGLHPDEMDFVITAKSIYLTGKDISGTWSPLSLTTKFYDKPLAELTSLLTSWIIGPLPKTLAFVRLPYLFNQLLLIVLVFLLAKRLFSFHTGLAAATIFSLSPWSFQFSRLTFEAPIATTFILTGTLLALSKHRQLLSLPFIFLAFFNYHGYKLLLIPWFSWLSFWSTSFSKFKVRKLHLILPALLTLVLFLVYSLLFTGQAANSRREEIIFFSQNQAALAVDHARLHSIDSVLTPLFINKITFILNHLLTRWYTIYSPVTLFITSEPGVPYSIQSHSYLNPLDFPLIIIGLLLSYLYQRRIFILLLGLVIIAPLPGIISSGAITYGHRASLLFPILSLIAGYGLVNLFKHTRPRLISYGFVFFYLIFTLNYFFSYFIQFPTTAGKTHHLSERIIAHYISTSQSHNQPVQLITAAPIALETFQQLLFYSGHITKATLLSISQSIQAGNYQHQYYSVTSTCPQETLNPETLYIIHHSVECTPPPTSSPIFLKDKQALGDQFLVINDKLCSNFQLQPFIHPNSIQDFQIEQLSAQQLCQTWFTN